MKKLVMWGSILFVVLLVIACSDLEQGDLPPEPAAPVTGPDADVTRDLAGQAFYGHETGFSSPNDVYEEDATKAQLFSLEKPDINYLAFSEDTFTFPVNVKHPGGLVYKKGYVYTSRGWELYEFPQQGFRGSNWIVEEATATLNLNRVDYVEGANFVVAYSCKKHAGVWRCGMQLKDGAGGAWMLQTFQVRNTGAPQEPAALQNVCTDTDGGKDYSVKGTTRGVYIDANGASSAGEVRDSCKAAPNANTLVEWYCDASAQNNPVRKSEEKVCDNGCENGACKAAAGTPSPTTTVDFKLYYNYNGVYDTVPLTTLNCFTASNVVTCTKDYQGSSNYGAYYGEVKPNEDGWKVDKVEVLHQGTVKYTPVLTCPGTAGQQAQCTYSVPASEYTATVDTYSTRITLVPVAATSTTPTYTVCQIPLADPLSNPSSPTVKNWIRTQFPIQADPADSTKKISSLTADQLKAKCAEMFIFGTTDGNPVAVNAQTIVAEHRLAGTIYETLVCKAACAPELTTIQRCKFISEIPDGVAPDSAASNAYYNPQGVPAIVPNPKCS
jgi:hypothetical protein